MTIVSSNDVIFNFFKDGQCKVWIPTKINMKHTNEKAIGALDCVGLNYYSGAYVKNFKMVARPESIAVQKESCSIYQHASESMQEYLRLSQFLFELPQSLS